MRNKNLLSLTIGLLTVVFSISCVLFYPSGGELKFDPDTLPDAQVGVPYEIEIHVTQNRTPVGNFSFSKDALPKGLKLEKVEGVEDTATITGVPEEAGTFKFKISVWCYGTNVSGQTGEQQYSIVVK